jgi:hypothetical protein
MFTLQRRVRVLDRTIVAKGIYLLSACACLYAVPASAANLYVRDGGTGTSCSDWANACDQVPAMTSITRGDTVYVADGLYAATTFSKPASGSTLITIKKATIADHGTSTGWQDSYGDGQAVWSGGTIFTTDYWLFTGVSRTGFRTGYGFKCENDNGSHAPVNGTACLRTADATNINHVSIQYVEVDGSHDRTGTYTDDGIKFDYSGSAHSTFNSVGFSWVHDVGEMFIQTRGQTNLTIEQTWMINNQSTAAHHAEGIGLKENGVCDVTIRWNYIENVEGTASIADPSGGDHYSYCNWAIYGNVFFYNSGEASSGLTGAGDGLVSNINGTSFTGFFYFVNNTIVSVDRNPGAGTPIVNWSSHGFPNSYATVVVANNLYYDNAGHTAGGPSSVLQNNASGPVSVSSLTYDYNAYFSNPNETDAGAHIQSTSGSPFVDVQYSTAGHTDFRLARATAAGLALSSPYNVDMNGTVRGADGSWDRGAFEFSGQSVPAPPAPNGVHIQ